MYMLFVIPSYKRSDIICSHTLNTLVNKLKIDENSIHIFIIKSEYQDYKTILNQYPLINIHHIDIEPGLYKMRNYITTYFPQDTEYISCDDDISDILKLNIDCNYSVNSSRRYKLQELDSDEFKELIKMAFDICKKNNSKLFGIYPVKNGYFMKDLPEITTDLRFCVGTFWGCINDQSNILNIEEKEDYERTLQYYIKYKSVIRFNNICISTKYYNTKGGLQSIYSMDERAKSSKNSCDYLITNYPNNCKYLRQKKSGIHEVKIY